MAGRPGSTIAVLTANRSGEGASCTPSDFVSHARLGAN